MRNFLLSLIAFAVLVLAGVLVWRELRTDGGAAAPRPPPHPVAGFIPAELEPLDPQKIVVDETLNVAVVEDEVLVTLAPAVTEIEFMDGVRRRSLPVRVIGRIPSAKMLQLRIPKDRRAEIVEALEGLPEVDGAANNFVRPMEPPFNDPTLARPDKDDWGLRRIDAPGAWQITKGGALIAVTDSGVQLEHEELVGKLVDPWSYHTADGSMQTGTFYDENGLDYTTGHGTHVSITAAGLADNGVGTAGISPDSPVMPIQVLGYVAARKAVTGSDAQIVAGLFRAMRRGAQVINISLGKGFKNVENYRAWSPQKQREFERKVMPAVRQTLRNYVGALNEARNRDVIFVTAAGNDALPARFDYMAQSERVIVVAATDQDDQRADFSRYGPMTTVSAPGKGIYSGFPDERKYRYLSGTSMAAPHVTGVVALMKTLKPELTFEEARDILVSTGNVLPTDFPIGPLVNARAALEELQRRIREGVPPPPKQPPLTMPGNAPPSTPPQRPPQTPPGPAPGPGKPGTPPGLQPPPVGTQPPPPVSRPPGGGSPPGETPPTDPGDGTAGPDKPIRIDDEFPTRPPPPAGETPPRQPPKDRVDDDAPPPPPPVGVITQPPGPPRTWEEVLQGRRPWQDAEVQRRIDEWLSTAHPVDGGRYDKYGRIVGLPGQRNTGQTPDWAGERYRRLWNDARDLASTNLGTLWEYLHGIKPTQLKPEPTPPQPTPPPPPDPIPTPPSRQRLVAKTPRELFDLLKNAKRNGNVDELVKAKLIPASSRNAALDHAGDTFLSATKHDEYGINPQGWSPAANRRILNSKTGGGSRHSPIVFLEGSWRLGLERNYPELTGAEAQPIRKPTGLARSTPRELWETLGKLARADAFEQIVRDLIIFDEAKLGEGPKEAAQLWMDGGDTEMERQLKKLGYRSAADVRRAEPRKLAADLFRIWYRAGVWLDFGGPYLGFDPEGSHRGKIRYRMRSGGNLETAVKKGRGGWKLSLE